MLTCAQCQFSPHTRKRRIILSIHYCNYKITWRAVRAARCRPRCENEICEPPLNGFSFYGKLLSVSAACWCIEINSLPATCGVYSTRKPCLPLARTWCLTSLPSGPTAQSPGITNQSINQSFICSEQYKKQVNAQYSVEQDTQAWSTYRRSKLRLIIKTQKIIKKY